MTVFTEWDDVKRHLREQHPETTDAQWEAGEQAALTVVHASILDTQLQHLGQRLQALREKQGLSRLDMAKRLRTTPSRIHQIDQGTLHDLKAIHAYATTLGATVTLSLEHDDDETRPAAP